MHSEHTPWAHQRVRIIRYYTEWDGIEWHQIKSKELGCCCYTSFESCSSHVCLSYLSWLLFFLELWAKFCFELLTHCKYSSVLSLSLCPILSITWWFILTYTTSILFRKFILPSQSLPRRTKPGSHWQANDPSLLMHLALVPHGCFWHSSISVLIVHTEYIHG